MMPCPLDKALDFHLAMREDHPYPTVTRLGNQRTSIVPIRHLLREGLAHGGLIHGAASAAQGRTARPWRP
jgi:hypothetical protein